MIEESLEFSCEMKFKCEVEDWAPGVICGMEGFKPTITNIDMENRIITLKFDSIIIDGRNS